MKRNCVSDALAVFDSVDKSNPNCVVMGDAQDRFSYDNLNKAFNVLMGLEKPVLIAMGFGYSSNFAGIERRFHRKMGTHKGIR